MNAFKRCSASALACGAALAACAASAHAEAAIVSAAPAVDFVSPFLNAVVGVAVPVGVALLIAELRKLTGIKLSDQQTARLQAAAATEAGALLAASETNLAGKSFTVASPTVAALAARVEKAAPGVAASLGVTPEGVKQLVAGEIGKLQASATTPAASPSPPPAK
jgi:uncharacterized membrane protein YcjF (UPF0283 family)